MFFPSRFFSAVFSSIVSLNLSRFIKFRNFLTFKTETQRQYQRFELPYSCLQWRISCCAMFVEYRDFVVEGEKRTAVVAQSETPAFMRECCL